MAESNETPLVEMFRNGEGKYRIINILAQRARALNQGARSAVPYQEGASDPLTAAIEEMLAGKLSARPTPKAPPRGA